MPYSRRRALGALAGGLILAGGGYAAGASRSVISASFDRVAQASEVIGTRFGALEYAVAGRGAPLLMIHGTGGGFDQGLRFGRKLAGRGFEVIAPSRFGYLRSAFPEDPSPANQADALVELLDHLGIDRLPVAGGSAGALPAAYFALRHPDRCSHLILLVPAANLTGRDPVPFTGFQKAVVPRLLSSDLMFWAALTLARDTMIGTLLATDPALVAQAAPDEAERARLILEEIMPVSARAQGTLQDGRMAGQPDDIDIAAIRPPMLVISAEDDRFGTAETARIIAGRARDATLVIYPSGGHIWIGHDDDVAAEIAAFVARAAPV